MTELQLLGILDDALGSVCNCRAGSVCAKRWHTYPRASGIDARAFVYRQSARSPPRVMLNLPEGSLAAFRSAAQEAGVAWTQNDARNRGWTRVNVDPSGHDADFLAAWARRTID